jgi:hypothetical protein
VLNRIDAVEKALDKALGTTTATTTASVTPDGGDSDIPF